METIKRLREVVGDKVPIIACTAQNETVGGEPGLLAAGFNAYIPKPVTRDAFLNVISGFLDPSGVARANIFVCTRDQLRNRF